MNLINKSHTKKTKTVTIQPHVSPRHGIKLTHSLSLPHDASWSFRQTFFKEPCEEHKRPFWHSAVEKQVSPKELCVEQLLFEVS